LDELKQAHVKALVVGTEPVLNRLCDVIAARANAMQLPAVFGLREGPAGGGLASYGPDFTEAYREAAGYVARILSGGKPADLPVLQPAKFQLVINMKTAKALGLTIPPQLLARADAVIE